MKVFLLFLIVQSRKIDPDANGNFVVHKKLDTDTFNFLMLGDWGGYPPPVYTTPIQLAVARSMGRTAATWKPEFVYGIGDNFYFYGVEDIHDAMWTNTFENVYTSNDLYCDWHLTTGNHDWNGGNATAQLAYSDVSHRWTFPAFHYTVDYELQDGTTMRIITVDTVLLVGITGWRNDDPMGEPIDRAAADEAWKWIEETIKGSEDFDYIFISGHYQTIDVRGYFDAALVSRLLPLMKQLKVTAFIQGHWHTMEHVQEIGFTDDSDIHFITCGSGALTGVTSFNACNENEVVCHFNWSGQLVDGAYLYFTISKQSAKITMISAATDDIIYTAELPSRIKS